MSSDHWNQVREKYKKSRLPQKCVICGTDKHLVLHHRTYKHLWREHISVHVVRVCQPCHEKIHFDESGKRTPLNWKALTQRQELLFKANKLNRKVTLAKATLEKARKLANGRMTKRLARAERRLRILLALMTRNESRAAAPKGLPSLVGNKENDLKEKQPVGEIVTHRIPTTSEK